ncbi:MAG: extracellular solute-binding protein [Vicinamibacterales bacterium]
MRHVLRHSWLVAALIVAVLTVTACGGGASNNQAPAASTGTAAGGGAQASADKNAYPVFPDADAGADPAVPADQGGKGFTGEGWETNKDYDLVGDPRAVKGGVFKETMLEFPGTLRVYGPETTILNYQLQTMVYESLLGLHPTTLNYIPGLATHWQIAPDKLTYRYRLNPNARFSTGAPVTADDVIASWKFAMDKGLQEAQIRTMMEKFDEPVAESKYIVRVKSKELRFLNFYNFSGFLPIFPADALKGLDGARYLKEYNFKLLPGSGAYIVKDEDVVKGKTVSVRRRADYWAEKERRNIGTGNFEEVRWVVVLDQKLAFEMFKKGDLDYYYVNISREWMEEMNFDRIQRGVVQKRKIFTDAPGRIQGIGFNLRRAPFDDVRVRKAITLLLNRGLLIDKLFFNEYTPMNSYFPGGVYSNPNNPQNTYDPTAALKLLAEAGWSSRDAQGRLVKDGRPLVAEYLYADKGAERWLTTYQEDLRKVGITLNLRLSSYETLLQLQGEHKFDLVSVGWVQGTFPDPEALYRSTFADVLNSYNFVGFKNARVDQLLDAYQKEFDQQKRVAMIREIDGILAENYVYILEWEAPFERIAYLNKFGHPESYLSRIGQYRDMVSLWWIDPAKEARFREAMGNPAVKLEVGQTDVRYWEDFAKSGGVAFEPPK